MAALQDVYERDLVRRLRAEFDEMPSMCLTFEQVLRLMDVDRGSCAAALCRLTAVGFLAQRGTVYRRKDRHRAM